MKIGDRKYLSILAVLFLIFSVSAIGEQDTDEKSNPSSPDFWSSSEFVSGASAADVGAAFKNGFISTDNIGLLDGSQLVGNEVYLKNKIFDALTDKQVEPIIKNLDSKQLSNLKDSQVSKTSLNSLPSTKWSSLKRETLSSVLSREVGVSVHLDLGSDGEGGTVTGKDFTIKKGTTMIIGDNINSFGISGFANAKFSNGILTSTSGVWASFVAVDDMAFTNNKIP